MQKRKDAPLPNDLPVEGICRELGVDAEVGLTDAEAARRHRRGGDNNIYAESRTPILRYAGYCSFDLLLILLLLTAATAAVFGEKLAYAVIIPTLGVSIILRTVAYVAARRYLDSCSSAGAVMPEAAVLRGGVKKRVDSRLVVRGDILILKEGDIVPADCRLISSERLAVYEEQATGVSGIVEKAYDSELGESLASRANMVFAGSSVLDGSGTAVAVYTGADTLVVRTRGRFKTTRGGVLRLSRLLDSYSRKWGALMALPAFAVTVVDLILGGRSLFEIFFLGLSLAAATASEYYSAIGDIAAACGISALRRTSGVSVRGFRSIETLAELKTIIVPTDGTVARDGTECRAYFFDGEVTDDAKRAPDVELLRYAAMATRYGGDGNFSESADVIASYLSCVDFDADRVYDGTEAPILFAGVGDGISFDTRLLASGDAYMSVSCGDAGELIGACAFVESHGAKTSLTEKVREGLLNFIAYHTRRGAAAVAVAKKNTPFKSKDRLPFTQIDMTLAGVLILYRPLAVGAVEAVDACRRAGIRVVMTGSGVGAARLAERAHIISGREDIITAAEFSAADEAERTRAASEKRLLIGFDGRMMKEFIKSAGDPGKIAYVASDGRGMRGELSALASVGAGFALTDGGDGGAQTLKMRADNIAPRADENGGGLASVVSAVAFAKRIYKNVSNIIKYLLTSQAARVFAVLFAVLSAKTAVSPQEILLWGLIFDFFAVIVLAFEKPDENALVIVPDVYERLEHPLRRVLPAVFGGALWAVPTMLVPLFCRGGENMRATVIFVSVLLSLVVVCGEYRTEYSVFSLRRNYSAASFLLAGVVAVSVIALTVIPGLAPALALDAPNAEALLISALPAVLQLLAYEFLRVMQNIGKRQNDAPASGKGRET